MAKGAAVLTFTIDESIEKEFNEWYNEYVKRMLRTVPQFESVTRYVHVDGGKKYCSYYVISDVAELEACKANIYGAERKPDSDAWKEWVRKGITDEYWEFFDTMFTFTQDDLKK